MWKVFEGEVIEAVQSDNVSYYVTYGDVTNEEDNLSYLLLDNFHGKNVRITIETID